MCVCVCVCVCCQFIEGRRGCVLCKNGLDKFGYRDVLLLRQFLTPNGLIIGHRQTGRCYATWLHVYVDPNDSRLVSQKLSSFSCVFSPS